MAARIARMAKDTNDAVLRDRTGSPTCATLVPEPFNSARIIDMILIEHCDEDVNVEEERQGVSSRNRLTNSSVIGTPRDRLSKIGIPLRVLSLGRSLSDFRASSDTTCPIVLQSRAAMARAAERMSSSRARVVRMMFTIWCITHQTSSITAYPAGPLRRRTGRWPRRGASPSDARRSPSGGSPPCLPRPRACRPPAAKGPWPGYARAPCN